MVFAVWKTGLPLNDAVGEVAALAIGDQAASFNVLKPKELVLKNLGSSEFVSYMYKASCASEDNGLWQVTPRATAFSSSKMMRMEKLSWLK